MTTKQSDVPDRRPFHALEPRRSLNTRSISLILTILGLGVWAISLFQARLIIDDWGLIHSLPVAFFLALVLLTIGSSILWLSSEYHGLLLCFQLCIFISMLWLTPLLLHTNLLFTRVTYGLNTLTEYVIRFGSLNANTEWYHNWPAFNLIGAIVQEVAGFSHPDVLIVAPFLMQFALLPSLYLFFRNMIGVNNYAWAALWLFYFFNYTGQVHFSPQGLAFVFLLTLLALLAGVETRKRSYGSPSQLVNVLITGGLIITHLLTSIVAIFVTVILVTAGRIKLIRFLLLFLSLLLVWLGYHAAVALAGHLPLFLKRAFHLDLIWWFNVARSRSSGSGVHQLVADLRILFSSLPVLLAVAGLILSARSRWGTENFALVIAAGMVLQMPFAFYGGEIVTRTYLYMLPVMAYFAVRLLRTKISAVLLLILLLLALPINVIAMHGNQAMEHLSRSQRGYWKFVETSIYDGRLVGGGMIWGWSMSYRGEQFYDPAMHPIDIADGFRWRENVLTGKWPADQKMAFIALSGFEEALYTVAWDAPEFIPELRSWLDRSPHYNLVYHNGEVRSYPIVLPNKKASSIPPRGISSH